MLKQEGCTEKLPTGLIYAGVIEGVVGIGLENEPLTVMGALIMLSGVTLDLINKKNTD